MNNLENEFDPTAGKSDFGTAPIPSTTPNPVPPVVTVPATPAPSVTATPATSTGPAMSPEKVKELRDLEIKGVADRPQGDASLSDEALLVKQKLAKEPKMSFFIPLEPGEKPGAYRSVTINGYRCEVKKGVMVPLPMSIAKLLMNAYQIEAEVLNNNEYNLANQDQGTRNALNA